MPVYGGDAIEGFGKLGWAILNLLYFLVTWCLVSRPFVNRICEMSGLIFQKIESSFIFSF